MADYTKNKERLLRLLTEMGKADMENHNYTQAVKKYERILELGVEEASVYSLLSEAYLKLNKFDSRALNIYGKTLNYQPNNCLLSNTLSEFYLKSNRFDPDAIKSFRHTLRFQTPLLKPIVLRLIKFYSANGMIEQAREIAAQTIHDPEIASEILSFFLQLSYKENQIEAARSLLAQSYKATRNDIYLKALCQIIVELKQSKVSQDQPFTLTDDEYYHCNQYLKRIGWLKTYNDLQLFIDVTNLILRYKQADSQEESLDSEEYEFFLSGSSPNKILSKGFSGNHLDNQWKFSFFKSIWPKMQSSNDALDTLPEAVSDLSEIDNVNDEKINSSICIIIKLKYKSPSNFTNGNSPDRFPKELLKNICSKFQVEGITHHKYLDDGLFMLCDTAIVACQASIKVLRSIEKINAEKGADEQISSSITINKIENLHALANTFEIAEQLGCAVKLNNLTQENFPQGFLAKTPDFFEKNKLIVLENIYDQIIQNKTIVTQSVGLIRVPLYPGDCHIYEIEWADPFERLRNGTLKKLGRFKILEQLTSNDYYSAYKGRDSLLERIVFIKAIRIRKSQVADDEKQCCKRFLDDAREVSKLSHRNIAIIYDVGEDSGFLYLAREFIDGCNFKQYMQKKDFTKNNHILKIFYQLCNALKYAHKNDIFHLNIKPSNIIVSANGDIKLTDFGNINHDIKKHLKKNETNADIAYLSPEQLSGKNSDARSDIFSVGVVLYEALAGKNPFYDDDCAVVAEKIIKKEVEIPSNESSEHAGLFAPIIWKALSKQPENRFQTVEQMSTAMLSKLNEDMRRVLI